MAILSITHSKHMCFRLSNPNKLLGRMMHEMSPDKVSRMTKPLWLSPEDLPEVRKHTNQQRRGNHAIKLTKYLYEFIKFIKSFLMHGTLPNNTHITITFFSFQFSNSHHRLIYVSNSSQLVFLVFKSFRAISLSLTISEPFPIFQLISDPSNEALPLLGYEAHIVTIVKTQLSDYI